MTYTLGADPTEHSIRVHRGTTTLEVKAELSRLTERQLEIFPQIQVYKSSGVSQRLV
jgi:hypothetical protein